MPSSCRAALCSHKPSARLAKQFFPAKVMIGTTDGRAG
jgi:hypothetical protein